MRGQPYLHILHSVPPHPSSPMSLQGAGKLASHVHRIPVVVQSLPLMYTTAVRSPSSLNNAIMLPLLDEAKSQGKGETTLMSPDSYVLFLCRDCVKNQKQIKDLLKKTRTIT